MRDILLLGSTGSIGTQTLDVIRRSAGALRVIGLSADTSWELLLSQIEEFQPSFAALASEEAAEKLPRSTKRHQDAPNSTQDAPKKPQRGPKMSPKST